MSELLKRLICQAQSESRLVTGLYDCIDHLYSYDSSKVLAVALTDSENEIFTQTILETFCYQNRIPFLKTDAKLLKRLMVFMPNTSVSSKEPFCVLILKSMNSDARQGSPDEIALLRMVEESEMRDETLVILNSNSCLVSPAGTPVGGAPEFT